MRTSFSRRAESLDATRSSKAATGITIPKAALAYESAAYATHADNEAREEQDLPGLEPGIQYTNSNKSLIPISSLQSIKLYIHLSTIEN
jgi:hypothetical protein